MHANRAENVASGRASSGGQGIANWLSRAGAGLGKGLEAARYPA